MLLAAVEQGVADLAWESDAFAYADGWDTPHNRYLGLRAGQTVRAALDAESVLVKPEAARRQLDADAAVNGDTGAEADSIAPSTRADGLGSGSASGSGTDAASTATGAGTSGLTKAKGPRRFYGSVTLHDSNRLASKSKEIADAVIQHLSSLVGANVTITIEVNAAIPESAPESVVRTVTENCRTLKFDQAGFEES